MFYYYICKHFLIRIAEINFYKPFRLTFKAIRGRNTKHFSMSKEKEAKKDQQTEAMTSEVESVNTSKETTTEVKAH